MSQIILASGSPRRRELLRQAGLQFKVVTKNTEEFEPAQGRASDVGLVNARRKASSVADQLGDGHLVIGADTVVSLGEQLFGKPEDRADAATMLEQLSGRTHSVTTAVSITLDRVERVALAVTTRVTFKSLSRDLIQDYHRFCDPTDKAGGYGIQVSGEMIVDRIEGSFDNVVGLPVKEVLCALQTLQS